MAASMFSVLSKISNNTRTIVVSSKLPNQWVASGASQRVSLASSPKANILDIPSPPANPKGPFFQFAGPKMNDIRKQNPGLKMPEVARLCGQAWNVLPENEKQVYADRFAKDRIEYKSEKEKWWNLLSNDQKQRYLQYKDDVKVKKERTATRKELKALNKPKKAISAYSYFISHYPKPDQKLSNREWFLQVVAAWNSTSEKEKEPYVAMAEKDKRRYEKEIAEWTKLQK